MRVSQPEDWSSIFGTAGYDVPLLQALGIAALARSRSHYLVRKMRHAAAEFATGWKESSIGCSFFFFFFLQQFQFTGSDGRCRR